VHLAAASASERPRHDVTEQLSVLDAHGGEGRQQVAVEAKVADGHAGRRAHYDVGHEARAHSVEEGLEAAHVLLTGLNYPFKIAKVPPTHTPL
jgi:hypothetical protein